MLRFVERPGRPVFLIGGHRRSVLVCFRRGLRVSERDSVILKLCNGVRRHVGLKGEESGGSRECMTYPWLRRCE